MKIESMHENGNEFRLMGYRVVAENRDEERIINLSEWTVEPEHFMQDTALHLIRLTPKTKSR